MQGDVTIDHISHDWYKVEFTTEEDVVFVLENIPCQKMERGHVCPIKISNKSFLQVERLENEPNVFPRDLVLGIEEQQKLAEDVILVFPQPIIVDSFFA
ncbi:hypothetical protein ACE6H2_026439 [Prunus campanulata]